MTDNQKIVNQGADFFANSKEMSDDSKLQYVGIDISSGTTANRVTAANPLPVTTSANSVYQISDLDEAGATKYYGFLDPDGNWYILQLTSTAARYIKGTSSYTTNWTGRAGLTYDYFNAIF